MQSAKPSNLSLGLDSGPTSWLRADRPLLSFNPVTDWIQALVVPDGLLLFAVLANGFNRRDTNRDPVTTNTFSRTNQEMRSRYQAAAP